MKVKIKKKSIAEEFLLIEASSVCFIESERSVALLFDSGDFDFITNILLESMEEYLEAELGPDEVSFLRKMLDDDRVLLIFTPNVGLEAMILNNDKARLTITRNNAHFGFEVSVDDKLVLS